MEMSSSLEAESLTLRDLANWFARSWVAFVVAVAVCTAATLALALVQPTQYTSSAQVLANSDAADAGAATQDSLGTQTALIRSYAIARRVAALPGIGVGVEELLRSVRAQQLQGAVLEITAKRPTAAGAAAVGNAFAREFLAYRAQLVSETAASSARDLQSRIATIRERQASIQSGLASKQAELGMSGPAQAAALRVSINALQSELNGFADELSTLTSQLAVTQVKKQDPVVGTIIQPAVIPTAPSQPRPKLLGGIGLVLGVGLGCVVVFVRNRFTDRINDAGDAQRVTGAPVLASFASSSRRLRSHEAALTTLPSWSEPSSRTADRVRTIRSRLSARVESTSPNILLVTGPQHSSALAANLAVATAQAGRVVGVLSIGHPENETTSALLGVPADQEHFLKVLRTDGGWVTGRRPSPLAPSLFTLGTHIDEMLTEDELMSPPIELLINDMRDSSDLVIVDVPWWGGGSLPFSVGQLGARVLLTLSARSLAERARSIRDAITLSGAELVGVVIVSNRGSTMGRPRGLSLARRQVWRTTYRGPGPEAPAPKAVGEGNSTASLRK